GLAAIEAARRVPIRPIVRRDLVAAAIFLRRRRIPIADAVAPLWVVLPLLAIPPVAAPLVRTAPVDVPLLAPVDVLLLVDVDVVVVPPVVAAVAVAVVVVVVVVDVAAAPVAIVAAPDGRADRHAGAEREQARGGDVAGRIRHHRRVVICRRRSG